MTKNCIHWWLLAPYFAQVSLSEIIKIDLVTLDITFNACFDVPPNLFFSTIEWHNKYFWFPKSDLQNSSWINKNRLCSKTCGVDEKQN